MTFEDPNCPYCKKLASEFAKMDDVTIYTFITPILGPDSLVKSKTIWCAPDHKMMWLDQMQGKHEPTGKQDCDTTALDRNLALARKLRVAGTPAILFESGQRIPGYVTEDKIVAQLPK